MDTSSKKGFWKPRFVCYVCLTHCIYCNLIFKCTKNLLCKCTYVHICMYVCMHVTRATQTSNIPTHKNHLRFVFP